MSDKSKTKILVGMSGGVDSSVTAMMLKKQGYDVAGVTMKVWDDSHPVDNWNLSDKAKHGCYGPGEPQDIEDAQKVADIIGIPFHVVDVVKEYNECVLSYFRDEYLSGRTPNPCVMCNARVKFGFLLERAKESGIEFDYFATGHYVKSGYDEETKRYYIEKGKDERKDQSYFLAFLSQDQIRQTMFPLGDFSKPDVYKLAEEFELPVVDRGESQDFIEGGDYSVLFDEKPGPGPIVDVNGKVLGQHTGLINYTIGQRKGLGIAAPMPLYVIDMDVCSNKITVGTSEYLMTSAFIASDMNWMAIEGIDKPEDVQVKVRLTQKDFPCTIIPYNSDMVKVIFSTPHKSVTPGQAAVFYWDGRILGGGLIREILKNDE
jgi:tRNA-uridine 2-sulfurtransferase